VASSSGDLMLFALLASCAVSVAQPAGQSPVPFLETPFSASRAEAAD